MKLEFTPWEVAQMFGLSAGSFDWEDGDSCVTIYEYTFGGKTFTRSDKGFLRRDEVNEVVAKEVMEAIAKVAAVEIK